MADVSSHDEQALAVAARHALHDEELVAAFAVGDVDEGPELERAQALTVRCSMCGDLLRDLRAIAGATRTASAFTAAAPRDFRISNRDAQRLRPTSLRVRWTRSLRVAFVAFGRPAGASLATLGLVGILVGSAGLGGMSAGAPAAPGAAEASQEVLIQLGPAATDGRAPGASAAAVAAPPTAGNRNDSGGDVPRTAGDSAAGPRPSDWLLAGSALALILGLAMLVVATRARSARDRRRPREPNLS